MRLSDSLLKFHELLVPPKVPRGIVVMNPYQNPETLKLVKTFFEKFYSDSEQRRLMLGINPGRFGAGVTGISFTDPVRMQSACGIPNNFIKKPELSSDFIYQMIDAYGGPQKFYGRYLISAVSPLGFTKNKKNINYYDDKKLEHAIRPFASGWITQLSSMGIDRSRCYCIGEGKNFEFLVRLNDEYQWFGEIIPLAHPRFIMQYRRKQLQDYIQSYLDQLR